MNEAATIPTWGYRPDGSAQIFELGPGESLPDGWHASPDVITDPAKATAEALSAMIAQATEPVSPPALPRFQLGADAIAAIRAENQRLTAEAAELRKSLEASQVAHAETLAHVQVLAAQLAEALEPSASEEAKPGDGGGSDVDPGTAPGPSPARTREEARAAVRALLCEGLPAREIARRVGVSPSTVAAVKAETERASS